MPGRDIEFGARLDAIRAWVLNRHASGAGAATAAAIESASRSAAAAAPAAAAKVGLKGAAGYIKGFVTGAKPSEPNITKAAADGLMDSIKKPARHIMKNSADYRNIGIAGGSLLAGAGIYRAGGERKMSAAGEPRSIIKFGSKIDTAWQKILNSLGHRDLYRANELRNDLQWSMGTLKRDGWDKVRGLEKRAFTKRATAIGVGAAGMAGAGGYTAGNKNRELSARVTLNSIINFEEDPDWRPMAGTIGGAAAGEFIGARIPAMAARTHKAMVAAGTPIKPGSFGAMNARANYKLSKWGWKGKNALGIAGAIAGGIAGNSIGNFFSARKELDVIRFGLEEYDKRHGDPFEAYRQRALNEANEMTNQARQAASGNNKVFLGGISKWSRGAKIGAGIGAATLGAGALYGMLRKRPEDRELSARDELNTIVEFARGDMIMKRMAQSMGGIQAPSSQLGGIAKAARGDMLGYMAEAKRIGGVSGDISTARSYLAQQIKAQRAGGGGMWRPSQAQSTLSKVSNDAFQATRPSLAGRISSGIGDVTSRIGSWTGNAASKISSGISSAGSSLGRGYQSVMDKLRRPASSYPAGRNPFQNSLVGGYAASRSFQSDLQDIIEFGKNGGDYKRHWSQKKTKKPKGKPPTKRQQAEEDEQHQMSARETLNSIVTLSGDPRPRNRFGMFSAGAGDGLDPNAIDATYKAPMRPQPEPQGRPEDQGEEGGLEKAAAKLRSGKKGE